MVSVFSPLSGVFSISKNERKKKDILECRYPLPNCLSASSQPEVLFFHINKAFNAAFYHLRNLKRIKKCLLRDSLITLVHACITSRLDYCNGLLFGLPKVQIAKLQRVQNAAARLILGIGKFSHITPALYELHWLPVSLRIDYKILLLTFKCIYGQAPTYLSDLISIKSNSLYNLTTLGARSFSAAAPKLWMSYLWSFVKQHH